MSQPCCCPTGSCFCLVLQNAAAGPFSCQRVPAASLQPSNTATATGAPRAQEAPCFPVFPMVVANKNVEKQEKENSLSSKPPEIFEKAMNKRLRRLNGIPRHPTDSCPANPTTPVVALGAPRHCCANTTCAGSGMDHPSNEIR